jgi:flagellar hook-length control protein FliK
VLELPITDATTEATALVASDALAFENKAPCDAAQADDKDADSTDSPATADLQAAIAAMSSLRWPVSACAASSVAQAAEGDVGAHAARAAPAPLRIEAATVNTTTTGDAAIVASRGQAQTALSEALPLTLPALPAVPDAPSAGAGHGDDGRASTDSGRSSDRDVPGSLPLAELRTSFSTVLHADTVSAKVERQVAVQVHDARWPGAVANEVRWCVRAGIQEATLRVVPDNLGPVELKVDVQDNNVNVTFTANHVDTRNALQDSLPRLRELLSNSGLMLGHANVQQEARRDSQFVAAAPRFGGDEPAAVELPLRRSGIGLVDEYA